MMEGGLDVMVLVLKHSALNSEWKKHKYVAKDDGKYYYPDGTKGARTMSTLRKKKAKDKSNKKSSKADSKKKSSALNKLANAAINGKYGNGEERKKKLGKKYSKVQNRVNQILLGKKAAKRITDAKKAKEAGSKALEKASKKKSSSSKKTTKKDTKKKSTSSKKSTTSKKTSTRSKSSSSSTSSKKSTASSSKRSASSNSSVVTKIKKQNAALVKKQKKQALANARLKGRVQALRAIAKIRG